MSKLCDQIESFGKSVGNASRYNIIEALFNGPKTVSELVSEVGQSQPLVSQNLKTLKAGNIVTDERKGKEIYYTLNAKYVLTLLKDLSQKIDREK